MKPLKKKGTEGLSDFFAYLTFALVLVIFIALTYISKVKPAELAKGEFKGLEHQMAAVNFMRSPVVVDGNKMDLAELIALAVEDKDAYEDKLNTAFEELEKQVPGVSLRINEWGSGESSRSKWGTLGTWDTKTDYHLAIPSFPVYIPSLNGGLIKVLYQPPQPGEMSS